MAADVLVITGTSLDPTVRLVRIPETRRPYVAATGVSQSAISACEGDCPVFPSARERTQRDVEPAGGEALA